MLVENGKTGCAFEINLDVDVGDEYVVLDAADVEHQTIVKRRGVPARLQTAAKTEPTLFEHVEKLREAERRRAVQTSLVKARATVHNSRVDAVKNSNAQQRAAVYWALDAKLREADKRRDELVKQIRERAQQHSQRVVNAKTTLVRRRSDLDEAITDALERAEANRVHRIVELQHRLRENEARANRIRLARDACAARTTIDTFWQLDQKLQEAERRRRRVVQARRDKASSPTSRIRQIREIETEQAKEQGAAYTDKLISAAQRRDANVNARKQRASMASIKVDAAKTQLVRRKSDLDETHMARIARALENRERHLHSVRDKQKARGLKVVRAQQAKRVMTAVN